jgi:phytoene synthase
MRIENAFAACEETVRRHDPDRYLSALFAPAERRPLLFALYAFNHEIARVAEAVREPMLGDIRLQWWREAVDSARDGCPRDHPVVLAIAEFFARTGVALALFEELIDARAQDGSAETFADWAALEAYGDATAGGVMRIAARVLGAEDALDEQARSLGIAYALTGLLRSLPFHAARGKLALPRDAMEAKGLSREEMFAGQGGDALKRVMGAVALRAHEHLGAARALPKPRRGLAALLPASTCRAYLKLMTKPGFDPFVTPAELPLYRRQLAMLGASLCRRI